MFSGVRSGDRIVSTASMNGRVDIECSKSAHIHKFFVEHSDLVSEDLISP